MATTESPSRLSTVVLFGKGLTPGKFRGLQRISNPNGTLTMVALDQNSSMIEMATKALKGKGQDREPTYEEIVEAKVDLARHLAPAASGVLIDAYYGAWSSVASGAIGPQTGLLVRVEMSGSPKNKVGAPLGLIEPGWSVEKIKLMGADAVKLLAQFEPTEPMSAEHQFQLIDHVYTECKKHDILLLLETVAFPFGGEKKTDASFLNRKAATVIESARQLSRFCDIYKAEFPGTMGHESDKPASRQPQRPQRGQRTTVGAAIGGGRLPRLFQAGADGHGRRRLGRLGWSGVLEGVLPPGRRRSTQSVRRDHGLQTSGRRQYRRPRARNALVRPLRSDQGKPRHDPGHRRVACPLWLSSGLDARNGVHERPHQAKSTDQRGGRLGDIRQPSLRKDSKAHGAGSVCAAADPGPWRRPAKARIDRQKGGPGPAGARFAHASGGA